MDRFRPLIKKLSHFTDLTGEDVESLISKHIFTSEIKAGDYIVRADDQLPHAFIISTGWAAREIGFSDGRVQIVNFMIPGDMFDLQVHLPTEADHNVVALTDLTIEAISQKGILELFQAGDPLAAALWWVTLQEEGILREQVARNGRRNAEERLTHLLLGLYTRARIVGLAANDRFMLPVRQSNLADALGLSVVHVNRVLRSLERRGFIYRSGKMVELAEREKLEALAEFDDGYLHLETTQQRMNLRRSWSKQ